MSVSVIFAQTRVEDTVQPSELFSNFPALKFGMTFAEAKKAVAATGALPMGNDTRQTEMTWDGKFSDMNGRATLLFKEGAGLWEIAVVVTAMDKRREVFDAWTRKVSDKVGTPAHAESMDHIENKWDLKDMVELEIRLIKDDESPVVDIHWVKN
jgi:hypothetical protein